MIKLLGKQSVMTGQHFDLFPIGKTGELLLYKSKSFSQSRGKIGGKKIGKKNNNQAPETPGCHLAEEVTHLTPSKVKPHHFRTSHFTHF